MLSLVLVCPYLYHNPTQSHLLTFTLMYHWLCCPLFCCAAAERLRLEIETMRNGIIGRTAELESLTTTLGQQQAAASAAVAEAAAALSVREGEVAAAAERLALLQAQQQEARQALAAAEAARDQGGSSRWAVTCAVQT
jgi:hypothetical protein